MIMNEVLEYLEKRGFSCKTAEKQYYCERDNELFFYIEQANNQIIIHGNGLEDELRELYLSDKSSINDLIIEYQSIVSELKIICIRKNCILSDKLFPLLEEIKEESE